MKKRFLSAICIAALTAASAAYADDPNQSHFPDAGSSATINSARAKGNQMNRIRGVTGLGAVGAGANTCPNGTMEVGTVHVPKGTRAPRDVTVIVEGDVNNVDQGRTNPRCR